MMSEWISCDDEMPEIDESIIGYRCGYGAGNFFFNGKTWKHDGWDVGDREFDDITHWMPLPEPPA